MKNLLLLLALFTSVALPAQIVGKWKTVDDETGKARSVVEIYEEKGKLYGRIVELYREPGEELNPICKKCTDDRKNQPVKGMTIIRDMQLVEGFYKNGTICDPKKGKVYDCEMWIDGNDKNKLQVRGYWGFIYRTQTWHRQP